MKRFYIDIGGIICDGEKFDKDKPLNNIITLEQAVNLLNQLDGDLKLAKKLMDNPKQKRCDLIDTSKPLSPKLICDRQKEEIEILIKTLALIAEELEPKIIGYDSLYDNEVVESAEEIIKFYRAKVEEEKDSKEKELVALKEETNVKEKELAVFKKAMIPLKKFLKETFSEDFLKEAEKECEIAKKEGELYASNIGDLNSASSLDTGFDIHGGNNIETKKEDNIDKETKAESEEEGKTISDKEAEKKIKKGARIQREFEDIGRIVSELLKNWKSYYGFEPPEVLLLLMESEEKK